MSAAQDAIHWAADTSFEGDALSGSSSWTDGWLGEGDRDGVFLLSVTDDGAVWLITERAADGTVSFFVSTARHGRSSPHRTASTAGRAGQAEDAEPASPRTVHSDLRHHLVKRRHTPDRLDERERSCDE